ncbi:hypothetical protein BJV82DRAFT_112323 [Fennellomyces sp. T-0311]|nr:hypothetical protein BJV82DRAFT_112323 [Fennellomyces sp. T-0311]
MLYRLLGSREDTKGNVLDGKVRILGHRNKAFDHGHNFWRKRQRGKGGRFLRKRYSSIGTWEKSCFSRLLNRPSENGAFLPHNLIFYLQDTSATPQCIYLLVRSIRTDWPTFLFYHSYIFCWSERAVEKHSLTKAASWMLLHVKRYLFGKTWFVCACAPKATLRTIFCGRPMRSPMRICHRSLPNIGWLLV